MDAVSVKRFVGWAIEGVAESVAVAALRAMRWVEAPQKEGLPERINSGTPMRVLVVGAHPDDESLSLGGTIAAHMSRGDRVTVAVLTDGGASRAGGLAPEEMRARRSDELRAAMVALGGPSLLHLGLRELVWDISETALALAPEFANADLIYTHSPVDFHPDHVRASALVARLVEDHHRVLIIETQTLLTPLLINRRVTLSPLEILAKTEAATRHRTQAFTAAASLRKSDVVNRCYRSQGAEVFWEVSPAALKRINVAMSRDAARRPFRGMRYRGYTDLLGVVSGTWARLRLRRLAQKA